MIFGSAIVSPAHYHLLRLKTFGQESESFPISSLLVRTDGKVYGITRAGGTNGIEQLGGAVFSISPDGSGFRVLKYLELPLFVSDDIRAGLIEARNGILYVASSAGLFQIHKDGSGYKELFRSNNVTNTVNPGLVESSDGFLYGTTWNRVFKVRTNGSDLSFLHALGTNRFGSRFGLIEHTNGLLYGTLLTGGDYNLGGIYRLEKTGANFEVIWSFTGLTNHGAYPVEFTITPKGNLLGYALAGSNSFATILYRLDLQSHQFSVLHELEGFIPWSGETNRLNNPDGAMSSGRIFASSDGWIYGSTQHGGRFGGGTIYKIREDGTGYQIIKSFAGGPFESAFPATGIVEAGPGNLLGASIRGGPANAGTLFKLRSDGSDFQVVHTFSAFGTDGAHPYGDLIRGSDSWLYGTSSNGGSNDFGTIYKLHPQTREHLVLHNFSFRGGDGASPVAGLAEGSDGALYGTTMVGGSNRLGTIFKIHKDGTGYRVLHHFPDGPTDGSRPLTRLFADGTGLIFGTTKIPTIFRINEDGSDYQVLHRFENAWSDTLRPSQLIEGPDGMIYGTTMHGGAFGEGTIFKIEKNGTGFTTIVELDGQVSEPGTIIYRPVDGLILASNNLFYGFASKMFSLDTNGTLRVFPQNFYRLDGTVVFGEDQMLYGLLGIEIFRLNLEGANYEQLFELPSHHRSSYPRRTLIIGENLYLTRSYTGIYDGGDLLKIFPGPLAVPRFESSYKSEYGLRILISGPPEKEFSVQSRTNLLSGDWQPAQIAGTINQEGFAEVEDQIHPDHSTRFYRVVLSE